MPDLKELSKRASIIFQKKKNQSKFQQVSKINGQNENIVHFHLKLW